MMTLADIILTIIIQVLFCLGFRTLLSDGMILHFIRKPFENTKHYSNWHIILKPIILCVICFSSFWGGLTFLFIHGVKWEIIICCISSAFVIKFVNEKIDW